MKKINLLAALVAVVIMSACGSSVPGKVVMNDAVDTVSYSIGMGRAVRAYKNSLLQSGIDSTVMKSFVKGFLDAAKNTDDQSKLAYSIGYEIGVSEMSEAYEGLNGQMFGQNSGTEFNRNNYLKGFVDGMLSNWMRPPTVSMNISVTCSMPRTALPVRNISPRKRRRKA